MAERRILIVDSNETFATMLKEGLETSGPYQAITVNSGTEALDALLRNQIDLAIVDMGLEDMDGLTLLKSMRQSKPGLRVMFIPLFGRELEKDMLSLEVQGILPKPFFIGDLSQLIQEALTCPFGQDQGTATPELVEKPLEVQPEQFSVPQPAHSNTFDVQDIDSLLEALFQEIRAEAVLFMRGAELIAHAGNVTLQRAQKLAGLAEGSMNAAHKIAAFLGEADNHFEQCTFEGSQYSVYSMNVTPDTILSVALSARTPLGIVRYNLRRASDALANVWRG